MNLKRFSLGQKLQLWLLSPIINAIVAVLTFTYRKNLGARDIVEAARASSPNGTCILAAWHCNCISSLATQRDLPLSIIVSNSFDGEMITRLVHSFGLSAIRGSSSRGGKEAISQSYEILKQGRFLAITVDGPRGPRFKAKFGAVTVSRNSQTPIVPVLAYSNRNWIFPSWDRFRVPKPFAKLTVLYGEPIMVPAETSDENLALYNNALEKSLLALEERADQLT